MYSFSGNGKRISGWELLVLDYVIEPMYCFGSYVWSNKTNFADINLLL